MLYFESENFDDHCYQKEKKWCICYNSAVGHVMDVTVEDSKRHSRLTTIIKSSCDLRLRSDVFHGLLY